MAARSLYCQVIAVLLSLVIGVHGMTDKMCRNQLHVEVQNCASGLEAKLWRNHDMPCNKIHSLLNECIDKMGDISNECICSGISMLSQQEEVLKIKEKFSKCENMMNKQFRCGANSGSVLSMILLTASLLFLLIH